MAAEPAPHRPAPDWPFWWSLGLISGLYAALITGMILADCGYARPAVVARVFASPEIRYATALSLLSCTVTTVLALWVAVPTGYLLARGRFPGKGILDAILDIPLVLPPLVIGLSLLILFQCKVPFTGRSLDQLLPVTYSVAGVVLAQFVVASAFAVRTMRVAFEHLSARPEQVALTLGCNRAQAFWLVALPAARRGVVTAATLAFARSLGEFGPVLVFAGATRLKTEVLPTTVFLELSVGNLEAAVVVALLMVVLALLVLVLMRRFGQREEGVP